MVGLIMNNTVKLALLLGLLIVEYNLPFSVHLKNPYVGEMNEDTFKMKNIYLSSEQTNQIAFPDSGKVERSKIPYALMAITLPVGLYVIFRKKRE